MRGPLLQQDPLCGLNALLNDEVENRLGYPTGHVHQRQALDLHIGLAQAAGEFG